MAGESDLVFGGESEEEAWGERAFDVHVVLTFWKGFEQSVPGGRYLGLTHGDDCRFFLLCSLRLK